MSDERTGQSRLGVDMVTFDCEDPRELAEFWRQALGTEVGSDADDFMILRGRPALAFQRVESPTPGKNRVHLDLSGAGRPQEVSRLVALGASVVRNHDVDGFCWTVMRDPAGNEFCVSDPHHGEDHPEP